MKVKKIMVPLKHGANREGIYEGMNYLLSAYKEMDKDVIDVIDEAEDQKFLKVKYLNTITNTNLKLAQTTKTIIHNGFFPLTIGGDHSVSLGSIAGISAEVNNLGVIWIDAHGDMNTDETTITGNIHGMILSALQGYGHPRLVDLLYQGQKIKTENIVIFGVRDLDDEERQLMDRVKVKYFEYNEIIKKGFNESLDEAITYLQNKITNLHISFDLDCMDPKLIPGVSVPALLGFNFHQADEIVERLFKEFNITSGDIVEYNPKYDQNNVTLNFLVTLIMKFEELANKI